MRDDICTIPVSEVFEENDGCPICRMRDTVEQRIISYILGDAMMEPDVRIETNRVGFCEKHYDKMLNYRARLQLSLILQTHIDEIAKNVFSKGLFTTPAKRGEKAAKVSDTCFICDKIEYGVSRMIETVYRCYENERDFRELFNNQTMFCLPHYERLISGADKKKMHRYSKEFADNLTRITGDYAKNLHENISKYCAIYDYRADKENMKVPEIMNSVDTAVDFLVGRKSEA
ncbi:MAG: DUF6062 family protein [Acutalibacteraceae bacterium]|nr:DUF6062 family protein [Acutalibacteraceae bacterium]